VPRSLSPLFKRIPFSTGSTATFAAPARARLGGSSMVCFPFASTFTITVGAPSPESLNGIAIGNGWLFVTSTFCCAASGGAEAARRKATATAVNELAFMRDLPESVYLNDVSRMMSSFPPV
jgi:hypothetical protein